MLSKKNGNSLRLVSKKWKEYMPPEALKKKWFQKMGTASDWFRMRKDGGVGKYIKQGTTIGRPMHMNKCFCGTKEAGVIESIRQFRMSV